MSVESSDQTGNVWHDAGDLNNSNEKMVREFIPFLLRRPGRLEEAAETGTYEMDATALSEEAPNVYSELRRSLHKGKASHSAAESWFEDVLLRPELLRDAPEYLESLGVDISDLEVPEDLPTGGVVKFVNPTPEMLIDIGRGNTDKLDKRVWANGLCTQTSEIKPRLIKAVLRCDACNYTDERDVLHTFKRSEIEDDRPCEDCGANMMKLDLAESTQADYQQIKLQEAPGEARDPQSPSKINVELVGDELVGDIRGGDRVTVEGLMSEFTDGDSTVFETFIEGDELTPDETSFDSIELTESDIERIKDFAERDDALDVFVQNLAPHIIGHEDIKEAIILQLVGGNKYGEGEDRRAGEIHILLIGDPSTGKSVLLKAANKLAPLSNKTTGTGATGVGLTATAQQEEVAGETQWVAKAGPLVLSDGGLACIDEFDKISEEDQSKLNDFFSSGQIHVTKASINTKMNARAAALVAANPVSGSFDRHADDLAGQFNLSDDLISRFDLRFPVFDIVDEERDEEIARIMAQNRTSEGVTADEPLSEEFMRKYIAYARQNVHPERTEEATELIVGFYSKMRSEFSNPETGESAIDSRSHKALHKLAEASARFRLSDTVDAEDAKRAHRLFMKMLNQMHRTGDGHYDIRTTNAGGSA